MACTLRSTGITRHCVSTLQEKLVNTSIGNPLLHVSVVHVLHVTQHRHHQALCTLQGELDNTSIGDPLLHVSIVHILHVTQHRHHKAMCTLQGELVNPDPYSKCWIRIHNTDCMTRRN
jgi:hypothetical protein